MSFKDLVHQKLKQTERIGIEESGFKAEDALELLKLENRVWFSKLVLADKFTSASRNLGATLPQRLEAIRLQNAIYEALDAKLTSE